MVWNAVNGMIINVSGQKDHAKDEVDVQQKFKWFSNHSQYVVFYEPVENEAVRCNKKQ